MPRNTAHHVQKLDSLLLTKSPAKRTIRTVHFFYPKIHAFLFFSALIAKRKLYTFVVGTIHIARLSVNKTIGMLNTSASVKEFGT